MSDFDSDAFNALNSDALNAQKYSRSAKSNPIFYFKGRRDRDLVLTYLYSPMDEIFCSKHLISPILAIFKGKRGVKVESKVQTPGTSRFRKNLIFSTIATTVFFFP